MNLTFGFWDSDDVPMARQIVEQLSVEAGFAYEIALLGKPGNCTSNFLANSNGTCPPNFGEFFFTSLAQYDVGGPWWVVQPSRQRAHDFTPPFADTALMLMTWTSPNDKAIDWLSFAAPFTYNAWLLCFVMCVTTGIAMFVYEDDMCRGQASLTKESLLKLEQGLVHSVEQAVEGLLAGASLTEATSVGGKVITFSFMFVILVVISAYTANTAAFLTVQATKSSAPVSKLSDIKNKGYTACAFKKDGIIEAIVSQKFSDLKLQTESKGGLGDLDYIGNMQEGVAAREWQ
jgi:hypothetical protein